MPKKILLADDSVTIQKVVELTFMEGDYEVTSVSNGKAAVEQIKNNRPDILLCDVIMPEMNGYEVTSFVKENPTYSSIPVILLTGTFEPFDEEKAKASGAETFVTKPFDSKMLVDKVDELLNARMVYVEPETPEEARVFQSRQEFSISDTPTEEERVAPAATEHKTEDSPFAPLAAEGEEEPFATTAVPVIEDTATSRDRTPSESLFDSEGVFQEPVEEKPAPEETGVAGSDESVEPLPEALVPDLPAGEEKEPFAATAAPVFEDAATSRDRTPSESLFDSEGAFQEPVEEKPAPEETGVAGSDESVEPLPEALVPDVPAGEEAFEAVDLGPMATGDELPGDALDGIVEPDETGPAEEEVIIPPEEEPAAYVGGEGAFGNGVPPSGTLEASAASPEQPEIEPGAAFGEEAPVKPVAGMGSEQAFIEAPTPTEPEQGETFKEEVPEAPATYVESEQDLGNVSPPVEDGEEGQPALESEVPEALSPDEEKEQAFGEIPPPVEAETEGMESPFATVPEPPPAPSEIKSAFEAIPPSVDEGPSEVEEAFVSAEEVPEEPVAGVESEPDFGEIPPAAEPGPPAPFKEEAVGAPPSEAAGESAFENAPSYEEKEVGETAPVETEEAFREEVGANEEDISQPSGPALPMHLYEPGEPAPPVAAPEPVEEVTSEPAFTEPEAEIPEAAEPEVDEHDTAEQEVSESEYSEPEAEASDAAEEIEGGYAEPEEEEAPEPVEGVTVEPVAEKAIPLDREELTALIEKAVKEYLDANLKELLGKALKEAASEIITPVAWEVIPEMAETIIKKRIQELETEAE